jgi:hypothetical protein
MAKVASPYGLRPVKLIGAQSNSGSIREFKLSTNNATAFFNGDLIQLTAAGNPQPLTATPTTASAGVVGACVGVRYVNPGTKQPLFGQTLPANAITAGYTDVFIRVTDDPDMLYQVQGSAAFGTLTNGADGAIGKNAALGNFGGVAATGNSTVNLVVGANGGSLAATNTLAVRIVDVVPGTELDAFPEFLVKLNGAVHSYNNPLGV